MVKLFALSLCVAFISVLFARDRKLRPMTSWPLWIALVWIVIVGTRFVSSWHGAEIDFDSSDILLEGSPLDRNIFLSLIIAGALVLLKRRPDWLTIFNTNRWFFIFFIYCAVSITWSDYPFVSFKRWIKELGNVFMVLIILTEKDPVQAIRAVFARYSYVVIPLSLLLIYFFPEIGTQYSADELETAYTGVTINKNTLGVVTLICALFLVWDLIYMRSTDDSKNDSLDLICRFMLLSMAAWLMYLASSMTALMCLLLGIGILVFMKFTFFRRQVRFIGTYSLVLGLLVLFILCFPGILETLVKALGRDLTFTGRTDLWTDLIDEPVNPLLGTGYQSFWLGSRADSLWEKYYYHPIQAHNGYLETYLNGGLMGTCLLMAMIVSTGSKLKKQLQFESSFGAILLAIFVAAIFYNLTEAMFGRLTLFWVILTIAALYQPSLRNSMTRDMFRRTCAEIPANRGLR